MLPPLTVIDQATDVAFVAILSGPAAATEIGVARFSTRGSGSDREFAVAVGEAWHRRGLGLLLMRRLIAAAQKRDIAAMVAISASDNDAMRGLADRLGMRRTRDPDGGAQVTYRVALPPHQPAAG